MEASHQGLSRIKRQGTRVRVQEAISVGAVTKNLHLNHTGGKQLLGLNIWRPFESEI